MSDQATTNQATIQDFVNQIQDKDSFLFTKESAELLVPWLHTTLQSQPKEDHNSDLCQVLAGILRLSNRLYGTPTESTKTCICTG